MTWPKLTTPKVCSNCQMTAAATAPGATSRGQVAGGREDERTRVDRDRGEQDGHLHDGAEGAGAARAESGQHHRARHGRSNGGQQQQAATARLEGVGPAVTGHRPRGVHRVLRDLGDTEAAEEGAHDADDQTNRAAADPFGVTQPAPNHGTPCQCRVQNLVLKMRVAGQDKTQHG